MKLVKVYQDVGEEYPRLIDVFSVADSCVSKSQTYFRVYRLMSRAFAQYKQENVFLRIGNDSQNWYRTDLQEYFNLYCE